MGGKRKSRGKASESSKWDSFSLWFPYLYAFFVWYIFLYNSSIHVTLTRYLHYYLNAHNVVRQTRRKSERKSWKVINISSMNSYLFKFQIERRKVLSVVKWKLLFTLDSSDMNKLKKIHIFMHTYFPRRKINIFHAIEAEFIFGVSLSLALNETA